MPEDSPGWIKIAVQSSGANNLDNIKVYQEIEYATKTVVLKPAEIKVAYYPFSSAIIEDKKAALAAILHVAVEEISYIGGVEYECDEKSYLVMDEPVQHYKDDILWLYIGELSGFYLYREKSNG